jgi:hypothetical protein
MTDIVFNDTSLSHSSVNDSNEARQVFENFVGAIGTAISDRLVESVIRSQICLQDAEIKMLNGRAWKVSDWMADLSVDRDLRMLMLTLDSKVPVEIDSNLDDEGAEALMMYEHRVGALTGPDSYAFGYALYTGDLLASIPTHILWSGQKLTGFICASGVLVMEGVVEHLSDAAHCLALEASLSAKLFNSIRTPSEFLRAKAALFPFLKFSPDVDDQVVRLSPIQLVTAMHKLEKMNATAEEWQRINSPKPQYKFSWSGESAPTMENDNYRAARSFHLLTGEEAIFERHLYFSGRHRIHFIEDSPGQSFIVGYIGDHLPTVNFPH